MQPYKTYDNFEVWAYSCVRSAELYNRTNSNEATAQCAQLYALERHACDAVRARGCSNVARSQRSAAAFDASECIQRSYGTRSPMQEHSPRQGVPEGVPNIGG